MCTFLRVKKNKQQTVIILNSYCWRVVVIFEYNMITIMMMIVKAVIKKKYTCNL